MIVDRRTFQVKQLCLEEVVKLTKAAIEGNEVYTRAYRIYIPEVAQFDSVVIEFEYEDFQEMQAAWAAWAAKPETADFWEKWAELTVPGGRREIWELAAGR